MIIEVNIQHIIAIWDECDHISAKRSSKLANQFWKGYLSAFPEAALCNEHPAVVSTFSPIFNPEKVLSFFHDGKMVPHTGEAKDLAIVKYCTSGFYDQDNKLHSLINDMRAERFRKDEPPMHADESIMVIFFTSDNARGMDKAINCVMNSNDSNRVHISVLNISKSIAKGQNRTEYAGIIFGQELRKNFIKIHNGGLLLKVSTDAQVTHRNNT